MKKKYGYMSGMPGCLPDYHSGYVYESEEEATQAAIDSLELNDNESTELRNYLILYIHGARFHEVGAGLVEIAESADPDEWKDENDW